MPLLKLGIRSGVEADLPAALVPAGIAWRDTLAVEQKKTRSGVSLWS